MTNQETMEGMPEAEVYVTFTLKVGSWKHLMPVGDVDGPGAVLRPEMTLKPVRLDDLKVHSVEAFGQEGDTPPHYTVKLTGTAHGIPTPA